MLVLRWVDDSLVVHEDFTMYPLSAQMLSSCYQGLYTMA